MNLSSLSGMQTASQMLGVLAVDVANVSAPQARAGRVDAATAPGGGVTTSVSVAPQAGVDLAEQVTAMMQAQITYAANAQVVQTQDATTGTLFDVRA